MANRYPQEEAIVYRIKLKGYLGLEWSDWFDGLTIVHEKRNETVLLGPIVDQAALHGVLKRIRDLGVPLLSVMSVDAGDE